MTNIEIMSKEQREALAVRVEVLDKVKELLLLPQVEMATVQAVADYYEVDFEAVKKCYQRHRDEINTDGVKVWTPTMLMGHSVPLAKMGQKYYWNVNGEDILFPNRGTMLFPKRAILRIGMLLQDSRVAQEVRTQLLATSAAQFDVVLPEPQTLDGVECYEKDGVVYLKLETVARGLGFTEVKGGRDYVMWRRVDGYLAMFGFGTSAERPDFIPENVFYRLAMKAKNEAAEKFQAKVADEIIPSIRRHGMYATTATIEKMLADPDTMIQVLTALRDERVKAQQLESKVEILESTNAMLAKQELTWEPRSVVNRLIRLYSSVVFGCNFRLGWSDYYRELKYRKGISLQMRSGTGSLLDRLQKDEWRDAISVAAALCQENGLDPAAAMNATNAAEYLATAAC